MSKLKYNRQKLLTDILYIAIIFSITFLIANVIGLDLSLPYQVLIVIIFSSIAKIFIIYPLILLISLVIIAWGSFFLIKYRTFTFLLIQEKALVLYFNVLANLNGRQAILDENKILIYLLIMVLISLFTALIVYRLKNIFFLIPVYLIIFLIYWYSFVDESYNLTAIFLLLFLILFGLKKYNINKLDNEKMFNSWATTSIVYSILIVSIAFFIPKTNDFISWPLLEQKVYDTFLIVEDLRYYKDYDRRSSSADYFDFSTSGFSTGDSVLGGPFIQSQRKIMTVETDIPMYLRGNVKHIYTGKAWKNMSFSEEEYNLNEDISPLDGQEKSFYSEKTATIKFDSFSSKTIFAPYKAKKIISNRNFSLIANNDHILTSTDATYRDESYIVKYLEALPYEVLVSQGMNKRSSELMDLDLYLQLPQEEDIFYQNTDRLITDRTRELTKAIVKDISTDYEKAMAIQNYLRSNYEYKLDVGKLPEGKEFVDHFLFEEKEGYCTYYATAMVVMLRLENIPTRYVEGYIVDEKIEKDKYQVRQKHGHAWVEAFIEPVGWVSFEPTAAYNDSRDPVQEDEIEEDTAEELPVEDIKPDPPVEAPEPIEDDKTVEADSSQDNSSIRIVLSLFLLTLLLSLLIRIYMRFLIYKKKSSHLNSLSNRGKIIYIYKDIINLLDLLDYPQRLGETHFDYANRIATASNDLKIQEIKDITSTFVKIKYSHKEVEKEDILRLIEYKEDLDDKLKMNLGKIKYFYRKYIKIYFKNRKEIP